MAIALVSSTKKAGTGTTPNIDTTGATLLVIALCDQRPLTAPTDSKSNTWIPLTERIGSFDSGLRIYYAENPTVGTGHNFSDAGGFVSLCMAAFSGTATVSVFDQQNGAGESSSPVSTGSVTPSEDNELVIAAAGGLYASGSIDSGFTIAQANDLLPGVDYGSALAYLIQTTAGAVNPAWTVSSSCSAAIATFKSASSPPPPPPPTPPPVLALPDLRRWKPVAY